MPLMLGGLPGKVEYDVGQPNKVEVMIKLTRGQALGLILGVVRGVKNGAVIRTVVSVFVPMVCRQPFSHLISAARRNILAPAGKILE
jgi:hypothetical protein